jgi:hypothetical protein
MLRSTTISHYKKPVRRDGRIRFATLAKKINQAYAKLSRVKWIVSALLLGDPQAACFRYRYFRNGPITTLRISTWSLGRMTG